ncbi:hypothetical protein M8818_006126 [Zalaria obscura]|uniref:Uncharacterized protein n=1 Tax=Zalaria obscura TaxID=2024903 RepID=A0ACC3S7M8_9PEZI
MFSFISTDGNTEPYNLSVTELRQQIYANLKVLYPQHKNIRVIVRGQIRGEVGMYAQAVVMVAREDDTHSVLLMADLVDDIHDVRKALMDLLMKTMGAEQLVGHK